MNEKNYHGDGNKCQGKRQDQVQAVSKALHPADECIFNAVGKEKLL